MKKFNGNKDIIIAFSSFDKGRKESGKFDFFL